MMNGSTYRFATLVLALASVTAIPAALAGQIEYQDPLEKAIDPPGDLTLSQANMWDVFAAYHWNYDSNIYRLNDSIFDPHVVVGPNASKADHFNTYSAGGNTLWQWGKQTLALDARVDNNRFGTNTDLNNTSTHDRALLNWGVGSRLSGQVGVEYDRALASFVNRSTFSPNISETTQYYGGGRFQLGPHWALFGGFLGATTKFSSVDVNANANNRKSGQGGIEYYSDANDSFGADFRYTHTDYPNVLLAAGDIFLPSYNEERARAFVRYSFTDKTSIDLAGGWLHRGYETHSVGDFSGATFRGQFQWLPDDKVSLVAQGWRELHAYFTADTEYFVSTGASVGPHWTPTDKILLLALGSWEKQDYAGNAIDPNAVLGVARHDKMTYGTLSVRYTPFRFLILDLSARRERRSSNIEQFTYNDTLVSLGVTGQFLR